MSIAPCGLDATDGEWTTEVVELPLSKIGDGFRSVNFETNQNGSIEIEYLDNSGTWQSIDEGTIPSTNSDTQFRFRILDSCLTRAWIDINDPHLLVTGSVSGDISSKNTTTTRWTVVANGITVDNFNGTILGNFVHQIPIGKVMNNSDTELEIKIKSWYNWENDGSAADVNLVINSIESNWSIFYRIR